MLAEVDGEKWIVSKDVVEEIRDQEHEVRVLKEVKGEELVGKLAINPVTGDVVPVLPAEFVNPEIGTGVVMSVPAHAPFDYIALEEEVSSKKVEGIKISESARRNIERLEERVSIFVTDGKRIKNIGEACGELESVREIVRKSNYTPSAILEINSKGVVVKVKEKVEGDEYNARKEKLLPLTELELILTKRRKEGSVIPVVACAVVKNNKLLLGKMAKGKADEGKWGMIGGKVEVGESFIGAIKREVKEEINCDVKNVVSFVGRVKRNEFDVYIFLIEVDGEPSPNKKEIDELRFFSYEEFLKLGKEEMRYVISVTHKDVFKKMLAYSSFKRIKPLIKLEGFSEIPARDTCRRLGIKSQRDRELLGKATRELYSKEFYNGILREIYGELAGLKVCDAKEKITRELIEKNVALKHYTLPVRFESRYGGKVHVKIVKDQWFLRYSSKEWKELALKCIEKMRFVPEEVRENFVFTVNWLKDWACVHKKELGTPLPWDKDWTIESLSDSTIYMAYYILAKYLQHAEKYGIDVDKLGDYFFDYVFLGKGSAEDVARRLGVDEELVEEMRREFEYWYPVDLRSSGKDLIQNHLTFFIFHHVALFEEKYWPRGIAINGFVLMDGRKMSKSLGNVIPMLHAVENYSADILRFLIALAGESGLDDANIEYSKGSEVERELKWLYTFSTENYNRGREDIKEIDRWMLGRIKRSLELAEELYEEMRFKTMLTKCYYGLKNDFRWYLARTFNNPNKECINKFIEALVLMLYPITPHICSEILEKIKGYDFALSPVWPEVKVDVDESYEKLESIVKELKEDVENLMKLVGRNVKEVVLIVASKRKFEVAEKVKELLESGKSFKEVMSCFSERELVSKLLKNRKLLSMLTSQEREKTYLSQACEYFSKMYNVKFTVEVEEESKEEKKDVALPAKPAIVFKTIEGN